AQTPVDLRDHMRIRVPCGPGPGYARHRCLYRERYDRSPYLEIPATVRYLCILVKPDLFPHEPHVGRAACTIAVPRWSRGYGRICRKGLAQEKCRSDWGRGGCRCRYAKLLWLD